MTPSRASYDGGLDVPSRDMLTEPGATGIMTTFEHAMIGINSALAIGLQRRHGWKIVALAGVAAVSPDWDGLTMLAGIETFDRAHRVWGHNIFVTLVVGLCLGALDYRFDLTTRAARGVLRFVKGDRPSLTIRAASQRGTAAALVWLTVGALAALSHLPADLVYSGGYGLPDWEVQLLWPYSRAGFVYPMVPWGDPGVTVVLVAGMFAMVRWPAKIQRVALGTLLLVVTYVVLRGVLR